MQAALYWRFIYNRSLAPRLSLKCDIKPYQRAPDWAVNCSMTIRWEERMAVSQNEIEIGKVCHKVGRHVNQHYDSRTHWGLASACQHYTSFEKMWSLIGSEKIKISIGGNDVVLGRWIKAAKERKPVCSCCSCLLAAAWLQKKKGNKRNREGVRERETERRQSDSVLSCTTPTLSL